jgi:hypothetical protein
MDSPPPHGAAVADVIADGDLAVLTARRRDHALSELRLFHPPRSRLIRPGRAPQPG